jgi:hypothetical protein
VRLAFCERDIPQVDRTAMADLYHSSKSPVLVQRTPLESRDVVPPAGSSKLGQRTHAQDKAPVLSKLTLSQWLGKKEYLTLRSGVPSA